MSINKINRENGVTRYVTNGVEWYIFIGGGNYKPDGDVRISGSPVISTGSHKGELATGDPGVSLYIIESEEAFMNLADQFGMNHIINRYEDPVENEPLTAVG